MGKKNKLTTREELKSYFETGEVVKIILGSSGEYDAIKFVFS